MFHKLRMSFSILCGIVCLLLVVLWVRSYWRWDWYQINFVGGYSLEFASANGTAQIALHPTLQLNLPVWMSESQSMIEYPSILPPFSVKLSRNLSFINLPHWLLAVLFAAISIIPWLRWQFSLRTLLIATTLVAVLLGAAVYAIR